MWKRLFGNREIIRQESMQHSSYRYPATSLNALPSSPTFITPAPPVSPPEWQLIPVLSRNPELLDVTKKMIDEEADKLITQDKQNVRSKRGNYTTWWQHTITIGAVVALVEPRLREKIFLRYPMLSASSISQIATNCIGQHYGIGGQSNYLD